MRILILTPTTLPTVTGNAITAERWRRSLTDKRETVEVLATEGVHAPDLLERAGRFQPDIIHIHQAHRAGAWLLDAQIAAAWGGIPIVVSPAGTDINEGIDTAERKEILFRIFENVQGIVVQGRGTLERLKEVLPTFPYFIFHIPKSVSWLGSEEFNLRKNLGWKRGDFVFFLPAGIRPVKRNLECLTALERVYAACPQVRLLFAGPILDAEYGSLFQKRIDDLGAFARWIPSIAPEAMRSVYESADVVLNTSFSEGLSNVLLEAMAAGRPLLASDIQGNRWLVLGERRDPPSGLLFDLQDPDDFTRKAITMMDDENLREGFAEAGKRRAAGFPTPEQEAEALIQAYRGSMAIKAHHHVS